MPRPGAQEPAKASPKEGFEHLLLELSAEYERLRNHNFELARENLELKNLELKAGSEGSRVKSARLPLDGVGPAEEKQLQVHEAYPEAAECHSAWRTSLASLEPKEVLQDQALLQEQLVTEPSQASKLSRVSYCSDGGSGVRLPTSIRVANIEAQFERLDLECEGKLYLKDLIRIMQKTDEPVSYAGLINLLRVVHGMPPLNQDVSTADSSPEVKDEFSRSEKLGLDLAAMELILEDGEFLSKLPSSVDVHARNLRKALQKEARSFGASPAAMSERPAGSKKKSLKRSFFEFCLETLPTLVILANTFVTGLSADHPEMVGTWDVCEYVFVSLYTIEFVVKLGLYGWKGYFCGPQGYWNLFDAMCLAVSLVDILFKILVKIMLEDGEQPELGPFLLIKIFRLFRLARLVRTLRFEFFHELKLMIMGVFSGLRVLTWAIVLLVVLVYLVGVAMTSLVGEEQDEFSSVTASMFTLFRCWTEGCAAYDGTPLSERLREAYGAPWMIFFVLMTMFVTVGLFNLIMAIFIDNFVTTQMMRKHKEMSEKSAEIEHRLKNLFSHYIRNGFNRGGNSKRSMYERARIELRSLGDGEGSIGLGRGMSETNLEWEKLRDMKITITRDVFRSWLEDEDFLHLLEEAEIETSNHFELFDVLDADMGGELSMDELTTGLMKLRGPVTKADIVAVRLKVRHLTRMVEEQMGTTE